MENQEAASPKKRHLALHWQIFVAMALGTSVGLGLRGLAAHGLIDAAYVDDIASLGHRIGKLFLALLSMVVVPLVFSSLVTSMTGLRGSEGLKRLGLRTASYYLVTSMLAIVTGLTISNLIRPGQGVDYQTLLNRSEQAEGNGGLPTLPEAPENLWSIVGDAVAQMIPANLIDAASSNRNMLAIIFFSILLGLYINRSGDATHGRLSTLFDDVFQVVMRMTQSIIHLAPYGIFGYLVFLGATTSVELVIGLAKYIITAAIGLSLHAFFTLPLIYWLLTKKSPYKLFQSVSPALATAFSTASGSGTLPLTIDCLNRAGVDRKITSFVLPLGATVNMDGTALYEVAAVLFISQMLGDLTFGQQVIVAITALVASVGAAGIPHAGTVMMVVVLDAVGLPNEAVLTILAVDRILDMMRTAVNVWSDVTGAAVIDHFETAGR